jgi:hypothetical protein
VNAAEDLAAQIGCRVIRRLAMLLNMAVRYRRLIVRLICVHAVIGRRTNETAEDPRSQRKETDRATEKLSVFDSRWGLKIHGSIIGVPRPQVKAASRLSRSRTRFARPSRDVAHGAMRCMIDISDGSAERSGARAVHRTGKKGSEPCFVD